MASPNELLAGKYAEIFSRLFSRIEGNSGSPLLVLSSVPHGGANGTAFRGANALVTSLVATDRGFGIPVWLTRSKISELGLLIRKGEHNTPITHYDVWYEDLRTRQREPFMDDAAYRLLPAEEQANYRKRCAVNIFPEFNIAQTNFSEVYPDQWDELTREFGTPRRSQLVCPDLDRFGDWLCPVIVDRDRKDMVYNEPHDEIRVCPKGVYADNRRWYNDLLHEMAHSTGSELRLGRNIGSSDLGERAREELIAELSAATVATMVGIQPTIQEHNLDFLKAWISTAQGSPMDIFQAVNESAKAAELITHTMGIRPGKSYSLDRLMEGVEKAERAREAAAERKARRQVTPVQGHRKGWKPVKVVRRGGKGL